MIKRLLLSFVIFFVLSAKFVLAVEVKDLYLVKWPVSEQSKSSRWKATVAGFKEVLIRKSGSENVLQSYNVQQAYSKVTNYLQRFEYAKQNDPLAEQPYIISLYFEPRLIDSLIQDAQMPLWGSNRPLTILWLAVEEDVQRRIVSQTASPTDIENNIRKSATRRGIPIITPLMDLDDELVISISDVWGRFPSAIKTASERYSADSILYGRLAQQGEIWVGKFGYINKNNLVDFDISAPTQEIAINDMSNRLAELLCEKYCVIEEVGEKNEIFVDISEISNFQSFKAVESYLFSLSSIRKAEIIAVESSHLLFKITLQGQIESLVEGINLSHKMQAVEPSDSLAIDSDSISDLPPADTIDSDSGIVSENEKNILTSRGGLASPAIEVPQKINLSQDENESQEPQTKKITLYYRWLG